MVCLRNFTFIVVLSLFILYGVFSDASSQENAETDPFWSKRLAMVREQIAARGISDPGVLASMAAVRRHLFIDPSKADIAYSDRPIPIGHGQTISQPFIVALMTELLSLDSTDVVFELGTGSGYQAAVLSRLVSKVFTMEIIEPLGKAAAERINKLGYKNVMVQVGDGYYGLPEEAPFDAIIVTAAAGHIPPPLINQLKPGGKMAIPVGSVFFVQNLMLVEKDSMGNVTTENVLPVRFVPLTGSR